MDLRNFLFAQAGQRDCSPESSPPKCSVLTRKLTRRLGIGKKKKKRIRWGHVTDHETALGMEQWGVFLSRSSQKLVSEK